VEYLIKFEVNEWNRVRTRDLCSNTMLNNHLSQKLKLETQHVEYLILMGVNDGVNVQIHDI
jgi:hypothetical protein